MHSQHVHSLGHTQLAFPPMVGGEREEEGTSPSETEDMYRKRDIEVINEVSPLMSLFRRPLSGVNQNGKPDR